MAASLANIAIRIPSRRRIATVPETHHFGRVEEIPEVPPHKATEKRSSTEAMKNPVSKKSYYSVRSILSSASSTEAMKNPVLEKASSLASTIPCSASRSV